MHSLLKLPVDEFWALGLYFAPSLTFCAVLVALVCTAAWFLRRRGHKRLNSGGVATLACAPFIAWLLFFVSNAEEALAITSLDSEDDAFAEAAYRTRFDIDLNRAIRLATDHSQAGNVRFYASCRIADILATNGEDRIALVLDKVTMASTFKTGFFGTNSLTYGFISPGYAEGPFSAKEIIEQRLRLKRPAP